MLSSGEIRVTDDYEQTHHLERRLAAINKSYVAFVTNKAFVDYFGCDHFDNILDYLHPEDVDAFSSFFSSYEGNALCKIFRFKSSDGDYHYNIFKLLENKNSKDNANFVNIEMIDVEASVDVNQSLIDDISKIRLLMGMTDEYAFSYDRRNNLFCMFRYEQLQRTIVYRMDIDDWASLMLQQGYIAKEDEEKFSMLLCEIKNYTEGISVTINSSLRTQSEIKEKVRFNGIVYHKEGRESIVIGRILFSDAEDQQQTLQIIDELNYDSLTNVYNKKSITEYAMKSINNMKNDRVTIAILDVDHFKTVNDTYGHLYGDKVLSRVGNKLKSIVGDEGLVGRIGGDEFMIVLTGINDDQILRSMLRAIRTQIKWEFSNDFDSFSVTCSIGASIGPINGNTYEDLFNKADFCLYLAKEKGRDRYVFFRDELHRQSYMDSISKNSIGPQANGREIKELEFIREFMKISVTNPKDAFIMAKQHFFQNYKIDSINIFFGNQMKKTYSYGQELENADDAMYVFSDEFKSILNGETYVQIGFFGRYTKNCPEFCRIMRERKQLSTIHCIIGTPDHILGLITFDKCKESSQWADYEVNCAVIVASMLSRIAIENEQFRHNQPIF